MNWVKSNIKNSDICNFDRLSEEPKVMLGVLFALTPNSTPSVQTWVLCLLQVNFVEMGWTQHLHTSATDSSSIPNSTLLYLWHSLFFFFNDKMLKHAY